MERIKLLALSGSLRKASHNTAAIRALKILAPAHVELTIGSISDLPLFNPDLEGECIPALKQLVHALETADGLVIASPEYAHGISGPMKNTLDWLVGGVEFPAIPIMLINTSPRASHAQNALREVLTTMSGDIIERSCISVPLLSSELDAEGIAGHKEISGSLKAGLARLSSPDQAAAAPGKATPAFSGEGVVEAVTSVALTISHDPIPALKWPSMTMDFVVPKSGLAKDPEVGERIRFDFIDEGGNYVLRKVEPMPNPGAKK